jgi:ketol-acid reductoisomerase
MTTNRLSGKTAWISGAASGIGAAIAPGLNAGNTLVWASGYNIGYDLIPPPKEVDVVMVAPRMTGNMVRELYKQMAHHSTTSQYSTLSRARYLLDATILAKMKRSLENDIQGGAFVDEWRQEQAAGATTLARLRQQAPPGQMSQAEDIVISLVQKAHSI